jgi:hypothetical protein
MDEEKIQAIGKALRTEGSRQKAIELIDKIETLPESLADTWGDDLAFALEEENVPYTQTRILRQLKKVAASSPEEAADTTQSVVRVVSEGLHDLSHSDISSSTVVDCGTEVLEEVLSGVDARDHELPLSHTDVDEFLEHGGTAQRKLGYRLLGTIATPDASHALTEDIEHEVESVKQARTDAVNDALYIAEQSLRGGGKLTPDKAYNSLSMLYASGFVEVDEGVLEVAQETLFDLVDQNGIDSSELLRSTGRLARTDVTFARSVVIEAVQRLEDDPEYEQALWGILKEVSNWRPDSVIDEAKALLVGVDVDDSAGRVQAFQVLATLAERKRSFPTELAEVVVRGLNADDRRVVMESIDAVENAGFYPPPEGLVRLSKEDGEVAKSAESAVRNLKQGREGRASSYVRSLESGGEEVSLFAGDSGDLYLKQRTESSLWGDVDVGTIRKQMVKGTLAAVNRGDDSPLVLPHYEPRDVILVGVALALNSASSGPRIGIYSPGSQSHWGMKGEVRSELREFGLSDESGRVSDATPIPDVIPHAYVWDEEVKKDSSGEASGRFILCKKLDDLEHTGDLEIILLNLSSRITAGTEKRIQEAESIHPEATLVSAYSYYAKNERDGRPRYGPPHGLDTASTLPGVNTIDAVLSEGQFDWGYHLTEQAPYAANKDSLSDSYETSVGTWILGDDDVRSLANASTLRVQHVESGDVSSLLDQMFELSASLRGVDDYGAGSLIFSRQLFFERLPVAGEDFDEWVRERYYAGERFLPPLIEERVEDVKQKANTIETLEAVQPLNKAEQLLQQIAKRLESQNPMFEELKEQIAVARESDERLAIFSGSTKHAQILEYSLKKHDVVTQTQLDRGSISVVSPDDARSIGVHDRLVVPGALHHENAGFYVHPRIAETVVLTYDREWASMIESHACEFVDLLNATVGELDYAPYAYPEVTGDLPVEKVEADEPVAPESDEREDLTSDSPDAEVSRESDRKSKAEILTDAMRSVSSREYREESGRYERETRHYTIETTSGEILNLTNHDRVLRYRETSSEEEFHWISPNTLTVGDTFVTFPSEIKSEIWEEQLRRVYESEIDADEALERLGQWCEALEKIWKHVSDEAEADGQYSETAVHGRIYETIVRSNLEFNRNRATVRHWFDSVLEADAPMDLVEDPSLRIGPRSYKDIEAIGRAFEYDLLTRDAEDIEAAMEGLRTINRRQGREFYDELRDQMNSHRSTRVSEAASHYEVVQIEERVDESDSD